MFLLLACKINSPYPQSRHQSIHSIKNPLFASATLANRCVFMCYNSEFLRILDSLSVGSSRPSRFQHWVSQKSLSFDASNSEFSQDSRFLDGLSRLAKADSSFWVSEKSLSFDVWSNSENGIHELGYLRNKIGLFFCMCHRTPIFSSFKRFFDCWDREE